METFDIRQLIGEATEYDKKLALDCLLYTSDAADESLPV